MKANSKVKKEAAESRLMAAFSGAKLKPKASAKKTGPKVGGKAPPKTGQWNVKAYCKGCGAVTINNGSWKDKAKIYPTSSLTCNSSGGTGQFKVCPQEGKANEAVATAGVEVPQGEGSVGTCQALLGACREPSTPLR